MRLHLGWNKVAHAYKDVKSQEEAQQYILENGETFAQIFVVENVQVKKVK